MIDLHTHTTASDGRCTPADLVARAVAARVTVLAVTDHDTTGGLADAAAACAARGVAFVDGIEITAVRESADVHVLGYFVDRQSGPLLAFLDRQRQQRVERTREIIRLLAQHGMVLDVDAILAPALHDPRRSVGRPWVARALVSSGHAANTNEAFDQWLSRGRPAFVPRAGAAPADVFARIHEAGGVASLAHPALTGHDEWIEGFAAEGLDALEAFHSEHDVADTHRYLDLAARFGLAVSGGSDFHGDPAHGPAQPGSVALPGDHYERLRRRATSRATASGSSTSS